MTTETTRFPIPEVDGVTMAFPAVIPGWADALERANALGFRKDWTRNEHCKVAETLFYKGGELPTSASDITDEERARAARYLKTVLGSYAPKHEDKIAVAGMLIADYFGGAS